MDLDETFAQQMYAEIDRRCKAYQLSNSLINLNEVFSATQKLDIDIEAEAAISNQNESNEPSKCDTIYANVFHQNEIKNEHINVSNHSVPVGRKPALPPKPPNALRLSLLKPKGYSCITENRNGKTSKIRIDPAELSMKERLALFEKHKDSVLVPEALSNKTHSKKMSVPVKSINVKRKSLYSPHVPHTSNLMKTIHQQKTIICDIDIDSEDQEVPTVCESNLNNDDDEKQIEQITKDIDSIQDLNVQSSDVMDGKKINSPEEQKNNSTQSTVNSKSFKPESHIEGEDNCEKRPNNEMIRSNYTCGIRLYGDLTPIVTASVPNKLNPNETIGLNDLHPSNYSLLSESNQYQPKEEDRWDRFIECLLFFCCVA